MKKIILALAVLLIATPALADVDIWCTADGNEVTVNWDATTEEPKLVRAFALDVTLDTDAEIVDVYDVNDDYWVYPGQWNEEARCWWEDYPGTLGEEPNQMTVEMGSLYADADEDHPNAPPASGVLFRFIVDASCNVSFAENDIRGGVVMEDPAYVPDVSFTGCEVSLECLRVGEVVGGNLITEDMYAKWEEAGKPDCWCYDCHSKGDTDGDCAVGIDDISNLVIGWGDWASAPCGDTDNDGAVGIDDVTNAVDGWTNGCGECTPIE